MIADANFPTFQHTVDKMLIAYIWVYFEDLSGETRTQTRPKGIVFNTVK